MPFAAGKKNIYTIIHLDHTLSPSRIPAHLRLPDTFCSLHTLRAFHALGAFHPSGFLTTSNAGRHLRQLFARRQVGQRVKCGIWHGLLDVGGVYNQYDSSNIMYVLYFHTCMKLLSLVDGFREGKKTPAVFRKFQEVQLVTWSPS